MDFRVAAEILLKYYDRLVAAGRAKPLPEPQPRFGGAFDDRLKPRRALDSLLTEFGLSPHPRFVVVVEGPTEGRIFPRVMETLGVEVSRDTIWIEDAEGVDRDISSLLAHYAPALDEPREDRYAQFQRPPTRFLIVFDAEGKVATPALREERRQVWIDRIARAMPQQFQTPIVREQLERFVYITTWKRSGESFEFAHFTDLQLATTIHALDTRTKKKPTLETHRKAIANIRAKRKPRHRAEAREDREARLRRRALADDAAPPGTVTRSGHRRKDPDRASDRARVEPRLRATEKESRHRAGTRTATAPSLAELVRPLSSRGVRAMPCASNPIGLLRPDRRPSAVRNLWVPRTRVQRFRVVAG
jgi:hypothetical protein